MILVILAVSIICMVVGIIISEKCYNVDFIGAGIATVSGLVLIISLIVTIAIGYHVSELKVIDDKITMYQEENARIEEQIATVVSEYQAYETEIFTTVKPDSAMTLVALYPELKADTLVQSQIEVYLKNNDKIKELKETNINGDVYRWWLYFGGREG